LIKETDPFGNSIEYAYDEEGNLVSRKDRNGYVTTWTYDELGRVIQRKDASWNETYYSYDKVGNLIAVKNARGYTTEYYYDELNRLIKMKDANNKSTSYIYDGVGNLLSVTDANGHTTRYVYNGLNRVITKIDALNFSTSYGYDAVGNLVSITDANNHTRRYEYDALFRLTRIVDASENETVYEYDAKGNLKLITDANGNVIRYEYDELDRLVNIISPLGYETHYSYDEVGNCIRRKDANGDVTHYEYDELNRLVLTSYPDGSSVSYEYDNEGNIVKVVNTGGIGDVTRYKYDKLYRLVSLTVDYGSFNLTINYSYDEVGNLIRMGDPYNVTIYGYDAVDRLKNVTSFVGVTTYEYDPVGNRILKSYPNGVNTTYYYTATDRLAGVITRNSTGDIIQGFAYFYDKVGNLKEEVRELLVDGRLIHEWLGYEYDAVDRLIKVTHSPSGATTEYTYDAVGNRLTKVVNGTDITMYTYDEENRLILRESDIMNYSYDNNGNLISTTDSSGTTFYEYDFENRLTKVTFPYNRSYSYEYSPTGLRLHQEKRVNGYVSETYYLYALYGVAGESPLTSHGATLAEIHEWGTVYFDPEIGLVSNWTDPVYIHTDGFGSSVSWTNETQSLVAAVAFDEFGGIRVIEDGWPWQISSKWRYMSYWSAIGWYNSEARNYNPENGRFVVKDQFLKITDLNPYVYANNNPKSDEFYDKMEDELRPLGLDAIRKELEKLQQLLRQYKKLKEEVEDENLEQKLSAIIKLLNALIAKMGKLEKIEIEIERIQKDGKNEKRRKHWEELREYCKKTIEKLKDEFYSRAKQLLLEKLKIEAGWLEELPENLEPLFELWMALPPDLKLRLQPILRNLIKTGRIMTLLMIIQYWELFVAWIAVYWPIIFVGGLIIGGVCALTYLIVFLIEHLQNYPWNEVVWEPLTRVKDSFTSPPYCGHCIGYPGPYPVP